MTAFDDLAQPDTIRQAAEAALAIQADNGYDDEQLLEVIREVLFDEADDEEARLSEGEMATLQSMVLAQIREIRDAGAPPNP
jgi:hypothetical protein